MTLVCCRKLFWTCWCRSSRLPGSGLRVSCCWGAGAGRQRCTRQQEDSYYSEAPAAGDTQRRGAEQAAVWCDHRAGWRPAQHPGSSAAEEERKSCSRRRHDREDWQEVESEPRILTFSFSTALVLLCWLVTRCCCWDLYGTEDAADSCIDCRSMASGFM